MTSNNQPEIEEKLVLVSPNIFDILLSDISQDDLALVAREVFGFELNSKTTDQPKYPVQGVLYGEHNRVIFPVIIQHRNRKIKTLMIYDSGCPFVFLESRIYNELGIDVILPSTNIGVHGEKLLKTHLSTNHFKEFNLMGQAFLVSEGLAVNIHGRAMKAYLVLDTLIPGNDEF